MAKIRFRHGFHLGNRGGDLGAGSERLIRESKPNTILAMQNTNPESLLDWARENTDGHLILRFHFDCANRLATAPEVMGWANGQVEMINRWLTHPEYQRIYNAGRLGVKIFNEPNMVGRLEGFGDDEIGMRKYNELFPLAANHIKSIFPNIKVVGFSLTPGNSDVYFKSDTVGKNYWFHGKEAAKENPTPIDINRAIETCLVKDAIACMDWFGVHLYPFDDDWDKDYRGLRFKQMWKFLPQRLVNNTFIVEGSAFPETNQEVRGDRFNKYLWKLNEFPQFKGAAWWWLRDGDLTWERHFFTDAGGNDLPVARVIKDFNSNQLMTETEVPPTNPNPNPTPEVPVPSDRNIDTKFNQLRVTFNLLDGANSTLKDGDVYYRLRKATVDESSGMHHVFVKVFDGGVTKENVVFACKYPSGEDTARTKAGNEWGDIALYGSYNPDRGESGSYTAYIKDGKSDSVIGLGLPLRQHVCYYLEFDRVIYKTTTTPPPTPPEQNISEVIQNASWNAIGVALNKNSWFYKYALRYQLGKPCTNEFNITSGRRVYRAQGFDKGIVYAEVINGNVDINNTYHRDWL